MSKPASTFATLLGTAAMSAAMMFNTTAANAGGLVDNENARYQYFVELSPAIAKATGDDYGRIVARGFSVDLEDALRAAENPEGKVRVVQAPAQVTESMLTIYGTVPQKKLSDVSSANDAYGRITVCVQNKGKAVGAWEINQANGKLTPIALVGRTENVPLDNGTYYPACGDTITAARTGLKQQYAAVLAAGGTLPVSNTPATGVGSLH